jgi:pimeloyl-ACP methyl ester carboxylesterase
LILFDRRGTGASERLHRGSAPTLDEWTADLLAVLDAVRSESAALFVEAEAGPVAINFVSHHPERVSALGSDPHFIDRGEHRLKGVPQPWSLHTFDPG